MLFRLPSVHTFLFRQRCRFLSAEQSKELPIGLQNGKVNVLMTANLDREACLQPDLLPAARSPVSSLHCYRSTIQFLKHCKAGVQKAVLPGCSDRGGTPCWARHFLH